MIYTAKEVVRRLKAHRPITVKDVLVDCELPLLYLSHGQFRTVFLIIGTDLVIKIPNIGRKYKRNVAHARGEYFTWLQIMKSKRKYLNIKRYMPVIHYFSVPTGITVVQKYKLASYKRYKKQIDEVGAHLYSITGHSDHDLDNSVNVGLDTKGGLRFLDLGYLLRIT
jgi:hypothetical protein